MRVVQLRLRDGVGTFEEYDAFLNSLNTISKELRVDVASMKSGSFPVEEFKAKYGHLRPGTYDILSQR